MLRLAPETLGEVFILISENLQAERLAIGRRVKRARDLSVGVWRSSVEGTTSGVRRSREKKRKIRRDSYHMGLCT